MGETGDWVLRNRILHAAGEMLAALGRFQEALDSYERAGAATQLYKPWADVGLRQAQRGLAEQNIPVLERAAAEYARAGDLAREAETWTASAMTAWNSWVRTRMRPMRTAAPWNCGGRSATGAARPPR